MKRNVTPNKTLQATAADHSVFRITEVRYSPASVLRWNMRALALVVRQSRTLQQDMKTFHLIIGLAGCCLLSSCAHTSPRANGQTSDRSGASVAIDQPASPGVVVSAAGAPLSYQWWRDTNSVVITNAGTLSATPTNGTTTP